MSDIFVPVSPDFAFPPRSGTVQGRITFVINSMEGGGAERAMANLLHYLLPQLTGHDVELVLLDDLPQVQHLPEGLRVITLDGGGSMLRSARALTRHFRGTPPSVCVSYLARANCLNVWLSALFGHRAIISERVQTSAHLAKARRAWLFRLITRFSYPRAAAVVAVSQGVAEDLVQNFAVLNARLAVIGNPIDASILARRAQEPPAMPLPERFILAVGRLVPNKNFTMLIAAYARTRPEADLVILGEGPERPALMAQIAQAGLADRVHMPGFVANPYPVMARAEYLVSCSNAEGFPNTLIEAMTLGCAVVATDCPSGPAEVLRGTTGSETAVPQPAADGILLPCEDIAALAAVMKDLESPALRADLAARASARARDFGVEDVVRRYLNLIEDTALPPREERRLER
jgi:glycosyltransferase involved in cell wall biosynthesis